MYRATRSRKLPPSLFARVRQAAGQRQPDTSIHARHRERRILDRLHEHAALLGPFVDALVEQVARQSVHLTHVPRARERLRVHVVRREMVASRHDQAFEIAVFARHAMERLDRAHDSEVRHEIVVGVDDQFCPRPFDRKRLDELAVARQSPILDDPARLESH